MSELSPSAGFQLAVTCECAFGEMVVAVGGCALLGSWNARQGLVLEWTPGHIWKGTIEKPVDDEGPVEYKYAIIRKGGAILRALWEVGSNRILGGADGHELPSFRKLGSTEWVSLGVQPMRPVSFVSQKDGQPYSVRSCNPGDAYALGRFFEGLSEETLSRYHPHAMTAAYARELCGRLSSPSDTARVVVTVHGNMAGYMIMDFAVPLHEIYRYRGNGITIEPGYDVSFAPVIADAYQGRGVAGAAMQCVLAYLKQKDVRHVILLGGVQDSNAIAKTFYLQMGFSAVGGYWSRGMYNVDMMLHLGTWHPAPDRIS